MSAFQCAAASRDRREPGFATASGVARWVLIEQPGPWGAEAPPKTRMDQQVWAAVHRRVAAAGARMLVIRRPGGASDGDRRRVFLADSRAGRALLLTATVESEAQLADLEFVFEPGAPGWQQAAGPLLCVCTQGKHDTCCAVFGRPLAAALQAVAAEQTWECSHIGGDRFAPNLLVLPEGLYFGRLEPDSAKEFVEGLAAGRIPLAEFRGRSSLSGPAQAASYFAAVELDADGVDAFAVLSSRQSTAPEPAARAWQVRLAGPGNRRYDVTVGRRMSAQAQLLTCHSTEPRTYPVYELIELAPAAVEE